MERHGVIINAFCIPLKGPDICNHLDYNMYYGLYAILIWTHVLLISESEAVHCSRCALPHILTG